MVCSEVSIKGDLLTGNNRRCEQAEGVLIVLRRLLWRCHDLSRRTKLRVYKASLIPLLLYDADTCPFSKALISSVHGFQSRDLRIVERFQRSYPVRCLTGGLARRTPSAPLLSDIFAGSITSCNDLMITLLEFDPSFSNS